MEVLGSWAALVFPEQGVALHAWGSAAVPKETSAYHVPNKPWLDTWRRARKAGGWNIAEAGPAGAPKAEEKVS